MATKLATGLSKGEKTREVTKKAVEEAKRKLGAEKVDLSIVYSSIKYDYEEVVKTIRELTGGAPLIGCSTAGEFTEEKVENQSIAVGLISSDRMKFFTAIAEGIREDHISAVKTMSKHLPKEVEGYSYLTGILFVDGLAGKGEEVSISVANMLGVDVKLAGGAAGDDLKFEKTYVFCDDKVATNAVSMCLIASKSPLFTGVKHGHVPLSSPLKTTKAEGCILYEVDGLPAWEVWKEKTREDAKSIGIDVDKLTQTKDIGSFLLRYEMGILVEAGEIKVRVPLSKNEDGSLNFACTIPEGISFYIMKSIKENQIDSARKAAAIAKKEAGVVKLAGALIFDCVVRGIILDKDFYKAVDEFKNILGPLPLLGWETYGEICFAPGEFSGFHNTTSAVLLLPVE